VRRFVSVCVFLVGFAWLTALQFIINNNNNNNNNTIFQCYVCFLGFFFSCTARGMKLPSLSPTHASAAPAAANHPESHFDSVFVFPRNSKQLLRNRVLTERVKFLFWAYVWPPLFWVFRASFGLSLLLSMYEGAGTVFPCKLCVRCLCGIGRSGLLVTCMWFGC
jgi:hypothetical protein